MPHTPDPDSPCKSSNGSFNRLQNNPSSITLEMKISHEEPETQAQLASGSLCPGNAHPEFPGHPQHWGPYQPSRGCFMNEPNPFGSPFLANGSRSSDWNFPRATGHLPYKWANKDPPYGYPGSCANHPGQSQCQSQSQPQEPRRDTNPNIKPLHTLFQDMMVTGFGTPVNLPSPSSHMDLIPPVDMFRTASQYIIHISLPGAKKEDLSIGYDDETSTLRVAGVVHRPGVDEEMYRNLVVSGREKEVGVFERIVRLGTNEVPACVVSQRIEAKLEEGILRVFVPKGQQGEDEKKHKGKGAMVENEDESDAEALGNDMTKEYVKVDVQ